MPATLSSLNLNGGTGLAHVDCSPLLGGLQSEQMLHHERRLGALIVGSSHARDVISPCYSVDGNICENNEFLPQDTSAIPISRVTLPV